MSNLDTRREALTPESVQGHPYLVGLHLMAPTTPSGAADLNVNIQHGTAVLPPKTEQVARQVDFDCGAAITDGESLPVSIVAAYNAQIDDVIFEAVPGTSHTTPGTEAESRAYYPSDAAIQAALPTGVAEGDWTLCGTVVFARASSVVTQHYDHSTRSYGVDPDQKLTSGDAYTAEPDAAAAQADLAALITGTGTIANGSTTETITAATLGGNYGGSPVLASFAEAPTAAAQVWAVWSSNDLVLTIDADNTADLDVTYLIDAR